MAGSTKKYLDGNHEAKESHNERNREYYRKHKSKLNKMRAERKKHRETKEREGADVKGKDVAHTKGGLKLQKSSSNRGSKSAMPGDKRARGGK